MSNTASQTPTSDPMVEVFASIPTAAISDALDQKTEERPACDLASRVGQIIVLGAELLLAIGRSHSRTRGGT